MNDLCCSLLRSRSPYTRMLRQYIARDWYSHSDICLQGDVQTETVNREQVYPYLTCLLLYSLDIQTLDSHVGKKSISFPRDYRESGCRG